MFQVRRAVFDRRAAIHRQERQDDTCTVELFLAEVCLLFLHRKRSVVHGHESLGRAVDPRLRLTTVYLLATAAVLFVPGVERPAFGQSSEEPPAALI